MGSALEANHHISFADYGAPAFVDQYRFVAWWHLVTVLALLQSSIKLGNGGSPPVRVLVTID